MNNEYFERELEDQHKLKKIGGTPEGEAVSKEQYMTMLNSGALDQKWTKSKNAYEHAATWFEKNKSAVDDNVHPEIEKVLGQGKRGMLTDHEINGAMRRIAGPIYPDFEPPTGTSMDIPDHLGPQWDTFR